MKRIAGLPPPEGGSVGAVYAVAGMAVLALLLAALAVGALLEGAARAEGIAEAALHAALSARDWAAAQACGCPRLEVGEAHARAAAAAAAAAAGRPADWRVEADPSGVVTVTVRLTTPTFLGWLGLPPEVPIPRTVRGQLEWWDAP